MNVGAPDHAFSASTYNICWCSPEFYQKYFSKYTSGTPISFAQYNASGTDGKATTGVAYLYSESNVWNIRVKFGNDVKAGSGVQFMFNATFFI
jgi:hypothetical protein